MNDTADFREGSVEFQMGGGIRGRIIFSLDLISLQIHDHHIVGRQLVIVNTAGFDSKISRLPVDLVLHFPR